MSNRLLMAGAHMSARGLEVANQTAAFGALTLAGAGGFQIVDSNGDAVTNATDDGTGTASGYSLSTGGLITPSTDGSLSAEDANTIDFTSDQGSATVTLDVIAKRYDFRTLQELKDIETAEDTSGDWTAVGRANVTITTNLDRFFKNNSYTSRITLTGEEGFAVSPDLRVENVDNLTIAGFEVKDTAGEELGSGLLLCMGGCSNLIIEDMEVHGKFHDPLGDYSTSGSYSNANGIGSVSATDGLPNGVIIRRCEIYDVEEGIVFAAEGADGVTLEDNEIYQTYSDAMKLTITSSALTAGVTVQRNIYRMPLGLSSDADNPHVDVLQFASNATNNGLALTNVVLRQNFAWEQVEARGRGVQGLVAFTDGGNNVILKDPIIVGNMMAISGNHHINIQAIDGGLIGHNTLIHPDTGWDTEGTPAVRLGNASSAGTITVRSDIHEKANVLEGAATYSLSDNLDIGAFGATHAYSDVFDGATFGPGSWTEIKSKYPRADSGPADRSPLNDTNIEDAGALGSGYQTVGDLRDSTGWSFDATYEA